MVLKPTFCRRRSKQSPCLGCRKLLMSPRGGAVQSGARAGVGGGAGVLLVCGRFEGVDERVIEAHALEEVFGRRFRAFGRRDRAMAVMDCCVRLLPGVMGAPNRRARRVSRTDYWSTRTTRGPRPGPARMDRTARARGSGLGPPRQGREWRRQQREEITRRRRPDLWDRRRTAKTNEDQ